LGLSLVALLLLSGAGVQLATAGDGAINYHAMSADEVPGRNHLLSRPGDTANKYSRGCESIDDCRGK
ncbi:hypothetical protein BAE44_0000260, partial [Dichanthelium oligosanthes]